MRFCLNIRINVTLASFFTPLSAPITIKKKKKTQIKQQHNTSTLGQSLAWFCKPSKKCISHELGEEEGFPLCLMAIFELENQQVDWPWTNKQTT